MPPRRLDLGSDVRCSDAAFGELADLVIDPTTRRVTHLVVRPHHRPDEARIVPIGCVVPEGEESGITLSSTVAEVEALERMREAAYLPLGELPVDDPDWDVGVTETLGLPYFQDIENQPVDLDPHVMLGYDRVPKGEVEIRRKSAVRSAEGEHLGHVDGLVVDAGGDISHLVLEHGHLWGHRDVTIPIGSVDRVDTDVVVLRISKREVGALPSRRVHRWPRRPADA